MDVLANTAENHVLNKFEFIETPPFDQKFENFDFGSQNYVYLSGSYLIFKFGYIILLIVYKVTNKICLKLKQYEIARKIGSHVFFKNYTE